MPKKPAEKRPDEDRVWIELDRPFDHEHAHAICEKASRMLKRLDEKTPMKFWWSENKGVYCLTTSEAGTYTELADRGMWFNLNYLGR